MITPPLRHCALATLILVSMTSSITTHADDEIAKLRRDVHEVELQIERLKRYIPTPQTPEERRDTINVLARYSDLQLTFGPLAPSDRTWKTLRVSHSCPPPTASCPVRFLVAR